MRFNREAFSAILDRSGYSSRAEFARTVGTSAGALHDIEHGRRKPSRDLILRFARELKVPVTAIIHEPVEAAR